MPRLPLALASDHPAYAGHFPGRPITPGVVLLDLAQRALEKATGLTMAGLATAKFLQPAQPGDLLDLDYEIVGTAARFEIRCGARRIAQGSFVIAPGPAA